MQDQPGLAAGMSSPEPVKRLKSTQQSPPGAMFRQWINGREVASLGTNAGAPALPFQDWRRIKEAFAPELIARALTESPVPVERCIDPFGGSGTTGLACQFLGVHPVVAEVNPYLADLIEAKLSRYGSAARLYHDLNEVVRAAARATPSEVRRRFLSVPPTFVEPGSNGRWIFGADVAERILALRHAIEGLHDEAHRRLFRVLLGGVLVQASNVVVSGKGRRYRRGWAKRVVPPERVSELFMASAHSAIRDIQRFGRRPVNSYELLRGDSRVILQDVKSCQLAVFSPPYANSSDYTDIYNVELWALGYLDASQANSLLRSATLSSHVQISREFPQPPSGSKTLDDVLSRLMAKQDVLWDRRIPAMVGGYFSDLVEVLDQLRRLLVSGGSAWIVVGDSRYAGVQVPVARVLQELMCTRGWDVLVDEPFRSLRTSAQQGGRMMLAEQLLVLRNVSC